MKNGLIIYNQADKEKNTWFIEKCLKALNDDNFSLLYKEESEVLSYVETNKIDFVINRSRNYGLLTVLEKRGIKCFNNSLTNQIANDKYGTYLFAKLFNFPCLETSLSKKYAIDFPYVVKSVDGHGGQEVYLVKNEEDQQNLDLKEDKKYIYQKFIPHVYDVRLYILNHQLIGAVKRENYNDFRSNYSLGGEVSSYNPPHEMVDIAITISTLLHADYIGVDFIIKDNTFVLNEIEDPVGSRMLYQTSEVDIVSLFIDFIKSELSK